MACLFGTQWCQTFWKDTNIFSYGFRPNIALLEMYAIVMVVEIWAPLLAGKTMILRSDNNATCEMIRNQKADISACLDLLHHLTKTSLHFQLLITAEHLDGSKNWKSNLLSRNRMLEFRRRFPKVDQNPQPPPASLWPPKWTPQDMLKTHQYIHWRDHSRALQKALKLPSRKEKRKMWYLKKYWNHK